MTPLLEFRRWCRRAPAGEKGLVAGIAVVLVALVAWSLFPLHPRGADTGVAATAGAVAATEAAPAEATVAGSADLASPAATATKAGPTPAVTTARPAAGVAPAQGAAPAAPAKATTATSQLAAGGSQSAASTKCQGLSNSDQGVSSSEVHIGVSSLSLAGGLANSTFGIRSDLHAIIDAVTDDVNKSGGVGCRKLVVTKYDVNPLDSTDAQAKCLQMSEDKIYADLDFAGYIFPAARACFAQHQIPLQTSTALTDVETDGSYPYLYSVYSSGERQVRNWALYHAAAGTFTEGKGFRKLGLLEESCASSVNTEIDKDLKDAGVPSDKISKFVVDCNNGNSASNAQVQQAVLQHKLDGANVVFLAATVLSAQTYVQGATAQGYKPTYGASDYGNLTSPSGNWDSGWDNTVGVTSTHSGEVASGYPNPARDKCNSIMTSHGVKPYATEQDSAVGAYCDLFNLFVAAISHAGANPTRSGLVKGLEQSGRFASAAFGDGLFNRPRKVTGGDFMRTIQYHGDCQCWKLLDSNLKPGY